MVGGYSPFCDILRHECVVTGRTWSAKCPQRNRECDCKLLCLCQTTVRQTTPRQHNQKRKRASPKTGCRQFPASLAHAYTYYVGDVFFMSFLELQNSNPGSLPKVKASGC
jgi:hypothetical protein